MEPGGAQYLTLYPGAVSGIRRQPQAMSDLTLESCGTNEERRVKRGSSGTLGPGVLGSQVSTYYFGTVYIFKMRGS